MIKSPRWKQRPPGSNWGEFGPDDQLGWLNLLTPLARWLREHRRSRFLLTAPPLRLPGAVGSPVNPIATV